MMKVPRRCTARAGLAVDTAPDTCTQPAPCLAAAPSLTFVRHCQQLTLHEGKLKVLVGRGQRATVGVASQPHAGVKNGGRAVRINCGAPREASIGVSEALRRGEGHGEVLPVNEVVADGVAPDQPERPLTAFLQMLEEPAEA